MTGAQRRSAPDALSAMAASTSTTANALNGAARAGVSSGTAARSLKTAGITVTGISMITVPETVGVRIRWKSARRTEIRKGTREEMMTSVASKAGPPAATALMQTAMKAPEAPMMSTWPEPIRPVRSDCSAVVRPQIATVPNTAHER